MKKIIDECSVVGEKLIASCHEEIEMIAQLLVDKGTVFGDEIYDLVGLPIPSIS